jgi:hypothetical protein
MTAEQKAAYIIAQAACMLATLEAMKVENANCESQGRPQAYNSLSFSALSETFGIHHNAALGLFNE